MAPWGGGFLANCLALALTKETDHNKVNKEKIENQSQNQTSFGLVTYYDIKLKMNLVYYKENYILPDPKPGSRASSAIKIQLK